MPAIGGASAPRTQAPAQNRETVIERVSIARYHYPVYNTQDPAKQWNPTSNTLCLVDAEVYFKGERDPLILRDLSVTLTKDNQFAVWPPDKWDPRAINEKTGQPGARVRVVELPYGVTLAIRGAMTTGDDAFDEMTQQQLAQAWVDEMSAEGKVAEINHYYGLIGVESEPEPEPVAPPPPPVRQAPQAARPAAVAPQASHQATRPATPSRPVAPGRNAAPKLPPAEGGEYGEQPNPFEE